MSSLTSFIRALWFLVCKSFTSLIIYLPLLNDRENESEQVSVHLPVHLQNAHNVQGWARHTLGGRNSSRCVDVRDQPLKLSSAASRLHITNKMELRVESLLEARLL